MNTNRLTIEYPKGMTLVQVKSVLKNLDFIVVNDEEDFELTEKEMEDFMIAEKEIAQGLGVSHEEVMAKVRQRYEN